MAWTYKLSPLFQVGQQFRVTMTNGDKGTISKLIRFEAGKTYQTEDEVLIKSLSSFQGKYPKTPANKAMLDKLGVEYIEKPCQSCGGRVIKYHAPYFIVEEV